MPRKPLSAPLGSTRRYLGDYAAHAHEHVQVLFGLEGCLELDVEGRAARVDPVSGLVVPAGAAHAFSSERTARVWVVDAPDGAGLDRLRGFRLPGSWSERAAPGTSLALLDGAARVLPRRRIDPAHLTAAIAGRLHERWPTSRMAARYALSVPRFHVRWRELTGETPQGWLRGRRLERAERLLRAGRSLEASALAVGYASASALCHALGRERGGGARAVRRSAPRDVERA